MSLGSRTPTGLNKITNIRQDYLFLREIDFSFNKLHDVTIHYLINHISAEALTTGRVILSGTDSLTLDVLLVISI
jgi:hypothetical protein